MTALQLEPSAQAPCTNTIFGSVFTSSLPFARRTSSASQRWKLLFLRFLSRNAALPFLKYLHYIFCYGCLTNGLCILVGLFSGLSKARPSTFLLPLKRMSL